MTFEEKIESLEKSIKPSTGNDALEMREDIYFQFSQLDDFEILRIETTRDPHCQVKAAILTTMSDPFFKIVVAHKWQTDLAFDNEWSEFSVTEKGMLFRFITWEDQYVAGEIWFERVKREKQ